MNNTTKAKYDLAEKMLKARINAQEVVLMSGLSEEEVKRFPKSWKKRTRRHPHSGIWMLRIWTLVLSFMTIPTSTKISKTTFPFPMEQNQTQKTNKQNVGIEGTKHAVSSVPTFLFVLSKIRFQRLYRAFSLFC